MPSAKRFALLRETVRNHPVVVAAGAASVGVLLGAFVAVQLLAAPQPRADSAAAPQAGIASKPQATIASRIEAKPAEAKPAPETTGSAPPSDRTPSADCEQETWPHLSPRCVEERRSKHRTRVISTDKLDQSTISAIEASPPAPVSKPAAPAVANAATVSPSPVGLAAAPSAVFAAPGPSPAPLTSAAPSPQQPAANAEAKKEERVATKSKRKPKAESRGPAKQESDDDDDTSVASNGSDDRASDERSARRDNRSARRVDRRRIVEDYDVPAFNGDGSRRVTIIRRGGGGLFEGLFGD